MKTYTVSIDIDLPRDRMVELFDDPDNLYNWQPGLQSFEHLEGEPGQPGAKSKLVYKMGKRDMELIETVHRRELPEIFDGSYAWPGGYNTLENRFLELGPERSRWETTCSYRFDSVIMKLMGVLVPGMFRKQQMKFLENFKAFCETGADVRETGK